MSDILSLIQFGAAVTLVAVPAIMLNRLLARAEGGTLADLFAIPLDAPWPRGVQEEEPIRWRVEALRPAPKGDVRPAATEKAHPGGQAAQLGTEAGRCA